MSKYLYSFRYDKMESDLSKLESRCIFNEEDNHKLLLSDRAVTPSLSAFIKSRLEIISYAEDYKTLISKIKNEAIHVEGFKVEYLVLDGDTTKYAERLDKLRDVGYNIEGEPDYYQPQITYALCNYEGVWCFGNLIKNKYAREKHKNKPCSYSNSININIAKALVNIATKANQEQTLLDACCGVGTIMLEACSAGISIEGCDINWKLCRDARANLAHFNYTATVYRSDIKDISKKYDAAIIDLPYNLLSVATDNDVLHIIQSTAAIADRLVIVSISDIADIINKIGLKLVDYCSVGKSGKSSFVREIWVCENPEKIV